MSNVLLAEWLHEFTLVYKASFVTLHNGQLFVALAGQVVSQKTTTDEKVWRVATATKATVFWLQNLQKPLEAVATSFIDK